MGERPWIDFYQVLGIDPAAAPEEVRAAYLSLARKHHPDSSSTGQGTEEGSGAQFKAIAEAYQTLSNPEKRRAYDRQRRRRQSSTRRTPGTGRAGPFAPILGGLADDAWGGLRETAGHRVPTGTTVSAELPITPEEARRGASISCTLTISRPCSNCPGETCPACGGRGTVSRQYPLRVLVPPGVDDGTLLRLPRSNCLLRIRIRPCW